VPELDKADKRQEPKFELEYLSFKAEELYRTELIPLKRLPRQLEKYTPYGMDDLTIGSWVKLASKMGHRKDGELRRKFRQHMYLGQE
jgi:endopolyphosphatase